VIPMSSDTVNIGTVATAPTVTVRANGGDGGAVSGDSSLNFGDSSLSASTYVCVNKISKELDEDSLIALEPVLGEIYSEALAQEENNQFINGTSTGLANVTWTNSEFQGGAADSTKDTFAEVAFADIPRVMFAVDDTYVNQGTFITSPAFFRHIVALQESNGTPLFASSWGGGGIAGQGSAYPSSMAPGFLAGRPVFLSSKMPAEAVGVDAAYYGDFSKFAMGDRRAVTVTWDDSVYAYELNRAVIVSERVGFKVLINGAFAELRTSTT
jgi:HK97 family phage major capsid protein